MKIFQHKNLLVLGLRRAYSLAFTSRGTNVINDLGSKQSAKGGGVAIGLYNSVEDGEKTVQTTLENSGKIHDNRFARISDRWEKTRNKGSDVQKVIIRNGNFRSCSYQGEKICGFDNLTNFGNNKETSSILLMSSKDSKAQSKNEKINHSPSSAHSPLSSVGQSLKNYPYTFDSRDVILYALGVGVSIKDEDSLKFLYEGSENFCPLPTFAVIPSHEVLLNSGFLSNLPGWTINLAKFLHGEQYIEIHNPIPTTGTLFSDLILTDVLDKGSGAVMVIEVSTKNELGDLIANTQWSLFAVGDGGFNGPRNSTNVVPLGSHPKRNPDAINTFKTSVDQHALYRLSGDTNPLHIDPKFAASGGFDEPILHGLCSLGISAKAILKEFCKNDVTRFKAVKNRFAKPVLPGQTLVTSMWKVGNRVYFETIVKENSKVCISGGYVDIVNDPSESLRFESVRLLTDLSKVAAEKQDFFPMKSDQTLLWVITDEKGDHLSYWTIDIGNKPDFLYEGHPNRGRHPTSTVVGSDSVLSSVLRGEVSPQNAYSNGNLKIEGTPTDVNALISFLVGNSKL